MKRARKATTDSKRECRLSGLQVPHSRKGSLSRKPEAICELVRDYQGDYTASQKYPIHCCTPAGSVSGSTTSETTNCEGGKGKSTLVLTVNVCGSEETDFHIQNCCLGASDGESIVVWQIPSKVLLYPHLHDPIYPNS